MTQPTKSSDIKREWHLVDAKDKVLGRISVDMAHLLMGKAKPYFVRHLDCGDFVVVVNAEKIVLTGKKETQKKYRHHSGYPSGLYSKTASQLRTQKPELLIRNAVVGMLPKTALGKQMVKKLYIFASGEHPYNKNFDS